MTHELHPLCTLFPRLSGAEFDALRDDIAANGLRQPIVLHEGMILDGGNRYRACIEAGVEPTFVDFHGGDPISFVLSVNFHRRHLSAGQQAAVVAAAQDWAKAQTQGGDRKSEQSATVALCLDTAADRAARSGASLRTQKMADKVAKADPELAKQVAHGEISLPKAVEKVEGKKKQPVREETKQDEPDDNDGPDLLAELEHAHAEIQRQQQLIDSLSKDDLAREIADWQERYSRLEGRLNAEITTANEAKKDAQRYANLLTKIRKRLGVEKNSQILERLS